MFGWLILKGCFVIGNAEARGGARARRKPKPKKPEKPKKTKRERTSSDLYSAGSVCGNVLVSPNSSSFILPPMMSSLCTATSSAT